MPKRCSKILASVQETILNYIKFLEKNCLLPENSNLLDIGCWNGVTTSSYANILETDSKFGIEIFDNQIIEARKRGIEVKKIDLEQDKFPFEDNFFDLVVCNQVFEHLKQIFYPMDQIFKSLKPNGYLIFSVPNLASFHNRLMLLFGLQPSFIRIFGPHVRGFTYSSFIRFMTHSNNLKLVKSRGVGFYPFPTRPVGNVLGNLWKSASHTPVLLLQKNASNNDFVSWNHSIKSLNLQTLF